MLRLKGSKKPTGGEAPIKSVMLMALFTLRPAGENAAHAAIAEKRTTKRNIVREFVLGSSSVLELQDTASGSETRMTKNRYAHFWINLINECIDIIVICYKICMFYVFVFEGTGYWYIFIHMHTKTVKSVLSS